jgi:RNA polymerase sigma-70 factor (ECF subfamily)
MRLTDAHADDDAMAKETEAIRRTIDGDAEAFNYLYQHHSRRIYALCLRMIGNATLAQEAMQETFMLAFRHIATFRGCGRFSTWLYEIAKNTVFMGFRRSKARVVEISFDNAQDDHSDNFDDSDRVTISSARSNHLDDRIQLESAIATLPAGYKMIFLLHDVMGFEHQEIAEMLGCTVGTTKSQLHKARQKLRRELLRGLKGRTNASASRRRSFAGHPKDPSYVQPQPIDIAAGSCDTAI